METVDKVHTGCSCFKNPVHSSTTRGGGGFLHGYGFGSIPLADSYNGGERAAVSVPLVDRLGFTRIVALIRGSSFSTVLREVGVCVRVVLSVRCIRVRSAKGRTYRGVRASRTGEVRTNASHDDWRPSESLLRAHRKEAAGSRSSGDRLLKLVKRCRFRGVAVFLQSQWPILPRKGLACTYTNSN